MSDSLDKARATLGAAALHKRRYVFVPLVERAAEKGVRIAFENYEMGGSRQSAGWNIPFRQDGFEVLFDALPYQNVGLEWEPAHLLLQFSDPMMNLCDWAGKIFHVHGKDATMHWAYVRRHGIHGPIPYGFHRHSGFGDTKWTDIISELRLAGFTGSIDIEGFHDPIYRDELELTGRLRALRYLKECRGGHYTPNTAHLHNHV